jgi:hypothetical protein
VTGNGIVAYYSEALALASGIRIGPHKNFSPLASPQFMVSGNIFFPGNWVDASTEIVSAYLGLRFLIHGQTHYGWARMELTALKPNRNSAEILGKLTGYAYETIPNKSIIAGRTKGPDVITLRSGSLGHLARGAR